MSIVTIAYLKTRFETGDFPTEQDFIDLIDTLAALPSGAGTYSKYIALMNQSGTSAPVIGPDLFTASGPIENTLSAAIVWTYVSAGNYLGTLSGAFPAFAKVWISISGGGTVGFVRANWATANTIEVFTEDDTGAGANGILNRCSIEIRVYP